MKPGAIYSAFDLLVVPFPFTEKAGVKRRPAVVLSGDAFNADHDQLLLSMITSSTVASWSSDVAVSEWRAAGLTVPCRIRLKMFTLPKSLVANRIGVLTAKDRSAVAKAFARVFDGVSFSG